MKQEEADLSAFQIRERKDRTIFVGNIALETTQKQLKKHFKSAVGPVEKVWLRSICVNIEGKKSERAKIITKDYGALKDNKNGYILFKEKESVTKALELNQTKLGDKHIRVDTLKGSTLEKKEGQKGGASEDDFKTTVFVGNLPYVVSEEEVREHFAKFGTIKNVRLVRDAKSHIGKGIGFVMFDSEEELRAAIAGAVKFSGRELRLKKATDPKKREKKANRKEAALEERREKRRQAKKQDEESEDDMNIQEKLANYSSDDSEDEKPKKKSASNIPKVPDLSDTKTFEKMTSGVDRGADRELKMQNTISFNQRKRTAMLKEMIHKAQHEGKLVKHQDTQAQKKVHNELFKKENKQLKVTNSKKRELKQKANLKKINSIKLKSKKI